MLTLLARPTVAARAVLGALHGGPGRGRAHGPRSLRLRRGPISFALALSVLLTAALRAQLPAEEGYVGAQTCGSCHAENYQKQSLSGHAQALFPATKHPRAAEMFADADWSRPPNFQFRFSFSPDVIRVLAAQGGQRLNLPVGWAFGAGDQAVTFVSHLEQERYIEYSFSWYAADRVMALTAGHPETEPQSLPRALGIFYDAFSTPATIMACFQCHSTGPVGIGDDYNLQPAEMGVRCEVCHGPGREHVAAVQRGELETARKLIKNPAALPAEKINDFCGACHRLPAAAGHAFDFSNPWHVRHQPPYLSESRCFRQSQGALTCFTCHDPHEKIRRHDAAHYDSRCTKCHEKEAASHPPAAGADVAATDCIACHMPTVHPQPYLGFTNHWIGIYREGTLQPRR